MTELNKKFGFTEEQLEQFDDDLRNGGRDGRRAQIPKEVLAILGDYYVQLIEKSVQATEKGMSHEDDIASVSHPLCHIYEDGLMSNELCHPIGNILLDKLIEKAEQGYYSHANRSIDGYWRSVKDNKDAQKGLKTILEKHPNYAFGQKYLSYMNGASPEDERVVIQSYIENPNMYFVTTSMVDIDGTLIRNGKANDNLIDSIIGRKNIAIYTGGDPVSQKKVLVKAIAEKILEKFPLIKEDFSVDTIVSIYSQDNEQNIALREKLSRTLRDKIWGLFFNQEPGNKVDAHMIDDMANRAKRILEFLNRLTATGGDQIKIYPKQAFAQENICLADTVIDDTQPAAQGMKSLYSACLTPGESPFWVKEIRGVERGISKEREITAEQAFAMYQQKCKENMIAGAKQVDKLSATEQKATAFSDSCKTDVKKTTR